MIWERSHKADPRACVIADRHYNRRKVGSPQFVPPGRAVVLITPDERALWTTSWPYAEYVRHAWPGAWVNSLFRNEGAGLSSELIRQAVAATRAIWPSPPALGIVSFVNAEKTRRKRDPGRCYRRAGWRHVGFTKGGLYRLPTTPGRHAGARGSAGRIPGGHMKKALVVLSSGIGNVVRMTPLVRMLHVSGYVVDVWLEAVDYLAVFELLEGSDWINGHLFHTGSTGHALALDTHYDVACLTHFATVSDREIHADAIFRAPNVMWQNFGDPAALVYFASRLKWVEPIPAPFVMTSGRRFQLGPGTLAIHAGCKVNWPWKRYPRFAEVAAQFRRVVVVGGRDEVVSLEGNALRWVWPDHVVDYAGHLPLGDTAALLSECAAMVSNDSGLSHIAATLGVPTFTIYGATRPEREAVNVPNVYPIENRDACGPGCRGRRCTDFVAVDASTLLPPCLATLEPATVVDAIRKVLPDLK